MSFFPLLFRLLTYVTENAYGNRFVLKFSNLFVRIFENEGGNPAPQNKGEVHQKGLEHEQCQSVLLGKIM
jgi:hypothetical protein